MLDFYRRKRYLKRCCRKKKRKKEEKRAGVEFADRPNGVEIKPDKGDQP